MRIGMLADAYKPHVSGVTQYISLNKRILEAMGHEVFVFTFGGLDYADDESNILRSPGIPLSSSGFYVSFSYPANVRTLLQSMDVAHVHHPFLSGKLALRYCRAKNIPVVFTNHTRYDLYFRAYLPALPVSMSEGFLRSYLPDFCRKVSLTISPSKGMATILERMGVDALMQVIPNGIDLEPFVECSLPKKRADFGFQADDVVLVYVGRIAPEKNLPFLLDSFRNVHERCPQARLLVVGGGPILDELKGRAANFGLERQIVFTGLVPHSELPAYLKMCDAFVTASVTEVHPLTVIEAMASELPVLGIDSPGVGDTVIHKETGLLSAEDLAEFSTHMLRLVSDADARQRMGAAALEASHQYDIRRTAGLVLSEYERLVDQKPFPSVEARTGL